MWIVEAVAALLFVASGCILFGSRFRENRALVIAAGLVTVLSTLFLTWEITKLAVRHEITSRERSQAKKTHSNKAAENPQPVASSPGAPSVAPGVERGPVTDMDPDVSPLFGYWQPIGGQKGWCTKLWIRQGPSNEEQVRVSRWSVSTHPGLSGWEQMARGNRVDVDQLVDGSYEISERSTHGEDIYLQNYNISVGEGVLRLRVGDSRLNGELRESYFENNYFINCRWRRQPEL